MLADMYGVINPKYRVPAFSDTIVGSDVALYWLSIHICTVENKEGSVSGRVLLTSMWG